MNKPLYLVDESNMSFQPRTADEAIILFNRMKRARQVKYDFLPQLLQRLARDLDGPNHDRFAQWIVNPNSITPAKDPGYFPLLKEADQPPSSDSDRMEISGSERMEISLSDRMEIEDEKQEAAESSDPTPVDQNTPCGN